MGYAAEAMGTPQHLKLMQTVNDALNKKDFDLLKGLGGHFLFDEKYHLR